MFGSLYLCATPIGNLEDITLRCLRVLKEVDIIAAEDTRRTRKLLNHYEINKMTMSYHEHNKKAKGQEIISLLKDGKDIALVTDAGMPCISDPGEDLVRLCIMESIEVLAIPGASASLTALSISGLETRYFIFEGFLPVKGKERQERIELLKRESRTIIIYEAPHRLLNTLKDLKKGLGNRRISISRELTKRFEETVRTDLECAVEEFSNREIKGEFVLIIEGNKALASLDFDVEYDDISLEEHLKLCMAKGIPKKEAISIVAKERGIAKREVYKSSIGM